MWGKLYIYYYCSTIVLFLLYAFLHTEIGVKAVWQSGILPIKCQCKSIITLRYNRWMFNERLTCKSRRGCESGRRYPMNCICLCHLPSLGLQIPACPILPVSCSLGWMFFNQDAQRSYRAFRVVCNTVQASGFPTSQGIRTETVMYS